LRKSYYIISEGIGIGIQWALFRYQQTYLGVGLVPLTREFSYVFLGIVSGKSGLSILLWIAGAVLLIIALFLTIIAAIGKTEKYRRHSAVCTFSCGLLFTGSVLVQYGLTLNGPSGLALPVGIPLILIVGGYLYWLQYRPGDPEDEPGAAEDDTS